jgi:hypothetical protein
VVSFNNNLWLTGDPSKFPGNGVATPVNLLLDQVAVVPVPFTTYTATIRAVNVVDNSFFAYIGSTFSGSYGGYLTTPGVPAPLQISFNVPTGASIASQINIQPLNPAEMGDIPQVGGMFGFNEIGTSLGPGSFK